MEGILCDLVPGGLSDPILDSFGSFEGNSCARTSVSCLERIIVCVGGCKLACMSIECGWFASIERDLSGGIDNAEFGASPIGRGAYLGRAAGGSLPSEPLCSVCISVAMLAVASLERLEEPCRY